MILVSMKENSLEVFKRNYKILKQSPLNLVLSARVNDIPISSVEEYRSNLKLKQEN